MKQLIVLRHGKAERPDGAVSDYNRGLTARGKRDAERVGEVLVQNGYIPELIITSSARRARGTAKRAGQAFDPVVEPIETEELYLVGVHDILGIVRTIPEQTSTAMIVGHNPGFGELVDRKGGPIDAFPTAAFGVIEFDIDVWGEADVRSPAQLAMFWSPKGERDW